MTLPAHKRAEAQRGQRIKFGPFEIERVLHLSGNGRRYWMLRGSRWVLWNAREDASVRKPAFITPPPPNNGVPRGGG